MNTSLGLGKKQTMRVGGRSLTRERSPEILLVLSDFAPPSCAISRPGQEPLSQTGNSSHPVPHPEIDRYYKDYYNENEEPA